MKNLNINNEIIKGLNPCYNPNLVLEDNKNYSVLEIIHIYTNKKSNNIDLYWFLLRKDFMDQDEILDFFDFIYNQILILNNDIIDNDIEKLLLLKSKLNISNEYFYIFKEFISILISVSIKNNKKDKIKEINDLFLEKLKTYF